MDDFVEIKTNKEIKTKIKSHLDKYSNNFYWNIKFNIPLLMESVNSNTTNVSDDYGNILKAKIFYVPYENVIAIEPHEKYLDNVYYYLNVSKKVLSENGKGLKEELHIRFKLKNKKIAEIKTFKGEIKFRKLPLSLRLNLPYIRLSTRHIGSTKTNEYEYKMPILIFPYMLLPFLCCIIICFCMPKYITFIIGYAICLVLTIIQIIILVMQYKSNYRKSIVIYNKGVTHYNKKELLDALDCFKKSFEVDNKNISAKLAINKVEKYLS